MKTMISKMVVAAVVSACAVACPAAAKGFRHVKDIQYYPDDAIEATDTLKKERCRLDVRIPEGVTNWPVVVWYHGGGLVHGPQTA